MATFKVGQRVRIIAGHGLELPCIGQEGTVVGDAGPSGLYEVLVDGVALPAEADSWLWFANELAPLTDPGADAFLESIRKMKPGPDTLLTPITTERDNTVAV